MPRPRTPCLALITALLIARAPAVLLATDVASAPGSYTIPLKPSAAFTLVEGPSAKTSLSLYGFGERAKAMFSQTHARKTRGCGYDSGVLIQTSNPQFAAQNILDQVAEAGGFRLFKTMDSSLSQMKPATMVTGVSDALVLTVVLTPAGEGKFLLSCSYVLDEAPVGSLDGSPAGAEKLREDMAEAKRQMERLRANRPAPGKESPPNTQTQAQ